MCVFTVNADDWIREIMQSETLVLVEFWHENCTWCKKLEPIYIEVAEDYKDKVKFAKLDVLENRGNQKIAFTYGVMSTPTLIFFCDGRPIETIVGFQSKELLKQKVNEMIIRHRECFEKSTELKAT